MCKRGICWFKLSIVLSLLATLTSLGVYFYFGGPPPSEKIDTGLKLVYISSIVSVFVSFVCIITLIAKTKATCILIFCNVGLVLVFLSSFYAHYILHETKLDAKTMTEYIKSYYVENGDSPPFLKSLEEQRKCCGIEGVQDYVETIQELESNQTYINNRNRNQQEYKIPKSCCTPVASNLINCGAVMKMKTGNFLPTPLPLLQKQGQGDEQREQNPISFSSSFFNFYPFKIQISKTDYNNGKNISPKQASTVDIDYWPIVDRLFWGFKPFTNSQLESMENVNVKDYLHDSGCNVHLNSLESFLSGFPLNVQEWINWTMRVKDVYLRFMAVYNFILFFVFNYHMLRYRFRRPAVAIIPRVLPHQVGIDNNNNNGSSSQMDSNDRHYSDYSRPNPNNNNNNSSSGRGRVTKLTTDYATRQNCPYAIRSPYTLGMSPYPNTNEIDLNSNFHMQPQPQIEFGSQFYPGGVFVNYTNSNPVPISTPIIMDPLPRPINNLNVAPRFPTVTVEIGASTPPPLAPPPPAYTPTSSQGPCHKCIGLLETGSTVQTPSTVHSVPLTQCQGQVEPIETFQPSAPALPSYEFPQNFK